MNCKNDSLDFRLILIVRRTFASYRIARSQFPTMACLIHAEACCVWMSCCNLATFLVLCWTTDPATGDWPSHRVSARGINCITWAWISYDIRPSSQFEGKINPSLILHYSIHYPPNHGHQIYLAEVLAGCHSTVAAMSTNQLDPREGKFRPFVVLGLAVPDSWKFAEWWHLH